MSYQDTTIFTAPVPPTGPTTPPVMVDKINWTPQLAIVGIPEPVISSGSYVRIANMVFFLGSISLVTSDPTTSLRHMDRLSIPLQPDGDMFGGAYVYHWTNLPFPPGRFTLNGSFSRLSASEPWGVTLNVGGRNVDSAPLDNLNQGIDGTTIDYGGFYYVGP